MAQWRNDSLDDSGGVSLGVSDGDEICFTLFTPEAVGNAHGIVLVCSYSLVILMVLTTNIALIVGLYKTNSNLTLAQRLFVLMSSMDLVIGVVFLPLNIYTIHTSQEQQDCSLIMIQAFVSMFFPFMSGLVLLLVVAHRFLLVVNTPLTRKLAERRHIRLCLMVSVLFSATMSVWYVFQKKAKSVTSHGTFYLTAGIIVSGYIFIITSINLKLLHFLKKAKKRIPGTTTKSMSVKNQRGTYHKRVSKTLAIMSAVVTVCYTPMAISFFVSGIFLLDRNYEKLAIIQIIIPWSQLVMTLNSALNSYFYIVRTKSMSMYYKKLLCKRYCCAFVRGKVREIKRSVTVGISPPREQQTTSKRTEKTELYSQYGSERL